MSVHLSVCVTHLLIGHAVAYGPNGEPSAIDKQPVAGPLALHTTTGLEGDQQGDTRHHGGLDKAIHHYPAEHYTAWRRALHDLPTERSLCWMEACCYSDTGLYPATFLRHKAFIIDEANAK